MTEATLLVGDSRSNLNLFYKTRFLAGDPFVFMEVDGRSVLLVSDMEAGRARKESIVSDVRSFNDLGYTDLLRETGDRTQAFVTMLARLVRESGAQETRVEGSLAVIYADALRADGINLRVDPQLLALDRRHKTDREIEYIQEAQRATERAMSRALNIIAESEDLNGILHFHGVPLTSERLRSDIEMLLLRENMECEGLIVAGGPGAADPHFEGAGPIRSGEAIVLDIFPRSKRTRFWADMTRTVVKGTPSDTLRNMYASVADALDAALSCIHAGVNGRDVHAAVNEVFERAGFAGDGRGPRLIHGTGHGVGLEIHEAPSLGAIDMPLIAGDVVTVEPGLYDPEVGAIRIEDLVVVTAAGHRNLTDFPRQFQL